MASFSELLDAALALPPGERRAFVESLSGADDAHKPRLRTLIARSLAAQQRDALGTLPKLAEPAAEPEFERFDQGRHARGARVGAYVLERRLGIGAMGAVWLASRQDGATPQAVALKFAHMAPRRDDLLVRLAREQRLLAALDHPNIARLFDAGVTAEGQPYLVLEYVEGKALDAYCAEHDPSLDLRLALFAQIVDAVAHAHERRIVHRDLKPANVLVTADGRARLLDFGIGKMLADGLPPAFALSMISGQPLTPAYASPEQILGAEVGFGSDVYSLGVVLYELLTGARPYVIRPGSSRALREAILVTAPLAPSEVVADRERRRRLRGRLDAIALRALGKRPEHRYATARELAAELVGAVPTSRST